MVVCGLLMTVTGLFFNVFQSLFQGFSGNFLELPVNGGVNFKPAALTRSSPRYAVISEEMRS